MKPTREQLGDLGWRALWTAVQAGVSALVVNGLVDLDANVLQLAALSMGAAVLSVVKTFASQRLGTS